MILHGIYDHGKITITEKNIPEITTSVEIILKEVETIKLYKNRFQKFLNTPLEQETFIAIKRDISFRIGIH